MVSSVLLYFYSTTSDMRKALTQDIEKKSIIPLPHPVSASEAWLDNMVQVQQTFAEWMLDLLLYFFNDSILDPDYFENFGAHFFDVVLISIPFIIGSFLLYCAMF